MRLHKVVSGNRLGNVYTFGNVCLPQLYRLSTECGRTEVGEVVEVNNQRRLVFSWRDWEDVAQLNLPVPYVSVMRKYDLF